MFFPKLLLLFSGTLWNTANHPRKSFDIQPLLSNVPTFSFMYRLSHNIKGSFDLQIVVLPDDHENVKLLVAKCSFSSLYTSYVLLYFTY